MTLMHLKGLLGAGVQVQFDLQDGAKPKMAGRLERLGSLQVF